MTIDEAIKHAEELAEENQRVVDTGIVCGDVTIDMLFCDDTEMIEEHLASYQECAETHRQFAEWLRELKEYRAILDELKDEITRAHNDLIESEYEYGENARYTENDRGYLGGLLHSYEMFGREYEEINADE